jgi:hypothetical protein
MIRVIFSLFFLSQVISAQRAVGKVFDDSGTPIQNVNVFIDGTTFATQSDANGKFSLNYKVFSTKTMIVSCVGFKTQYISDYNQNQDLIIALQTDIVELDEISINFDQFSRARKLKFFKTEFLGKSANGRNCSIQNEKDISFYYDKNARTLQAFANRPIVVINKNLAYKVNINLIGFEAKFYRENLKSSEMYRCYFEVLTHFESLSNTDEFKKRRAKALNGSKVNFFRDMAGNNWEKSKFKLFFNDFGLNPSYFFQVSNDGYQTNVELNQNVKSFKRKQKTTFNVVYNNRRKSQVTFDTQSFVIDIFGNNSQIEKIFFSGDMATRRVGDMLPIDFGIK